MMLSDAGFQLLANNIRELVPISDGNLKTVLTAFQERRLERKEFLLSEGETSNHMRFVIEGSLRSYYLKEDGQEFISQFGIPGWWINDLYSYLTQKPAIYYIQAVTPARVLQIHRDQLTQLYDEVPIIERFYRIKFERAYVALQERNLKGMSLTAKERYEQFREQYRDIEQSVPQYMIASYLGITPEFLSALRRK